MKNFLKALPSLILLAILITIVVKRDEIYIIYRNYLVNTNIKNLTPPTKNEYFRETSYNYVQTTNDFVPNNRQELINIIYTIINYGDTEYTFYCPVEYEECLTDLDVIAEDQSILSDINNFVHPYNTFQHIETKYDESREITITYTKNYTESRIKEINNKIDELYPKLYRSNDTQINNIKRVHDYIANNTRYDTNRADNEIITYKSDTAYGPLIQGYAICGGYSDAMSLFLDRMNINNYRVSSPQHVWNAIEINNKWYHLDLTWDDPITDTGENYLLHDYFLINTKTLESKNIAEHDYSKLVYSELQ